MKKQSYGSGFWPVFMEYENISNNVCIESESVTARWYDNKIDTEYSELLWISLVDVIFIFQNIIFTYYNKYPCYYNFKLKGTLYIYITVKTFLKTSGKKKKKKKFWHTLI